MATLKTEPPSTPDATEDKTEIQHYVPSPEQAGQRIQHKRRDNTSTGGRGGKRAGITSRRRTRAPEDWDNDSIETEIEGEQREDVDARLQVTWQNYGVHKLHRRQQMMDAALVGNCTGLQNPRVLPRVFLGYGLGYRILYPRETRTRDTGTWVGGGLMAGKLAQIWT